MILQIEKLVYGGEGLARLPADANGPGKTAFVSFVIPGEQVEAIAVETRPGFVRAQLNKVIKPSSERAEPGCRYFSRCGGCHYQHISYETQLRYKVDILRETLRRTAKLDLAHNIQVHSSPPWNYRNRARLRVRHTPSFSLGYLRHNSHDVLPVESCPISSPLINEAIAAVWKLGCKATLPETLQDIQFLANHDDAKLLVEAYVKADRQLTLRKERRRGEETAASYGDSSISLRAAAEDLRAFAAALHQTLSQMVGMVILPASPVGDEMRLPSPPAAIHVEGLPSIGDKSFLYNVGGHDYRVSGGSFFQTNRFLIETLGQVVIAGRTGRGALDLYAGGGLFTAQLARNFDSVLAVEAAPQSFADLRHNALSNVKCVRAMTERFLAERGAKLAPDLVVVDPPRAGLGDKVSRALGRMTVPSVTYVSCDPVTLSRDLRILLEFGFRVEQAHLVDMFPQTFHMETVLHLAR